MVDSNLNSWVLNSVCAGESAFLITVDLHSRFGVPFAWLNLGLWVSTKQYLELIEYSDSF